MHVPTDGSQCDGPLGDGLGIGQSLASRPGQGEVPLAPAAGIPGPFRRRGEIENIEAIGWGSISQSHRLYVAGELGKSKYPRFALVAGAAAAVVWAQRNGLQSHARFGQIGKKVLAIAKDDRPLRQA
jgi:hypothetical protein